MTSRWALHTPLVPGPPRRSQKILLFLRRGKSRESCSYDFPLFPLPAGPTGVAPEHPILASHTDWDSERAEGPPYDHHTFGIGVADWLSRPALRPPLPRWDCTAPLCQYPPSMVPAACLALAPPLWRPVLGAPWRGAPVQRIDTRFAIFVVVPFSSVEIGNKDV